MNDPQEAARTANAFAEAYVEFTREQNIQRLLSVREFLERQLVSFRQDFLRVGEELSKSSREGQETALGQMTLDSVKAEMAKRLVNLEMERIAMKFTYMPDHRALVQVEREIAEIRNRLTKQINPGKQDLPLLELLHGSQAKLGMYNYILQKQQEIRLAEAAELGSARIIDYAIAPKVPVSPNVSRNARVGGLLGLSLGIGLALFLNHLNRSVRNVKDVEEGVGLPVFGAIPNIGSEDGAETAKQWGRRRKVKDPAKLLLGIDSGRSYAVEAYRALRTRIRFAVPEASARVFLFTSAQPGEGKSLTVANLAIAMSRRGGRILVVDCDMRKPDQSKLFHVREESGISDVLVGRNTWREMTKPTRVNNVDLVPCGEIPEDPAELLAGPAMGQFLAEAEQHYDLVLLDSPPILPFTDASVLAPLVSGVFLVVRSGRTRAEAIARVRSILESIKAKLIAVVLNGVSPQDEIGYYPYAYYYGAYPASGKRRWFKRVARGVLSRFRRV
ncbi:MAG: polysaccharide biosynthesis tyrosine autokinase [Deltaproteobacteria bacterium]|nr:polysaccharide biosynthesis tyrosine autokinase [Deltaproteobacteria bacterium]